MFDTQTMNVLRTIVLSSHCDNESHPGNINLNVSPYYLRKYISVSSFFIYVLIVFWAKSSYDEIRKCKDVEKSIVPKSEKLLLSQNYHNDTDDIKACIQ